MRRLVPRLGHQARLFVRHTERNIRVVLKHWLPHCRAIQGTRRVPEATFAKPVPRQGEGGWRWVKKRIERWGFRRLAADRAGARPRGRHRNA